MNRETMLRPVTRMRSLGSACGCLLGFVMAAALAAEPPPLPPIVDPPGNEHHVGKFVFVELVTPDLAAAKTFYGGLFGWTFRAMRVGPLPYVEVWIDDHQIGGMVSRAARPGERRQPAWLSFMAVTDVDAVRTAALREGGRSLSEPHDVPGHGRTAVLADPQGAVFGVLASSNGDPPDVLAAPGEWIWASLFATDPDKDAAFYQNVFDYEVFDLDDAGDAQHLILASGGYARAAANPLPSAQAHPHWLNFVRVDDAARTVARAVALGGKVLLSPRADRQGGQIAIVADPQGAPFGILEWADGGNPQVSR